MADRLKTILSEEFQKLINERDEYRKKSITYKEAAEKVDKQVNRLQHFLQEYGTDIEVPDKPTKQIKPKGPSRHMGATATAENFLLDTFPEWIGCNEVGEQLKNQGFSSASARSLLERFISCGKVERMRKSDGSVLFRLKENANVQNA